MVGCQAPANPPLSWWFSVGVVLASASSVDLNLSGWVKSAVGHTMELI